LAAKILKKIIQNHLYQKKISKK